MPYTFFKSILILLYLSSFSVTSAFSPPPYNPPGNTYPYDPVIDPVPSDPSINPVPINPTEPPSEYPPKSSYYNNIEKLEIENERLRARIRELQKKIKALKRKLKACSSNSPCQKGIERINNAIYNYKYDSGSNMEIKDIKKALDTLLEKSYLKNIPKWWKSIILIDEKLKCKEE